MTKSLLFWILMLIWLVFGLWSNWSKIRDDWKPTGGTLMLFVLLLLLGWAEFGAPLKE